MIFTPVYFQQDNANTSPENKLYKDDFVNIFIITAAEVLGIFVCSMFTLLRLPSSSYADSQITPLVEMRLMLMLYFFI